jgi:1-acyl-sn-glycerol-3-phosphate acyltransferase
MVGRVEGLENLPPKGTGYVAAANHRSYADGIVMPQILVTARKEPVHMVSYEEIFRVPVAGTILAWAEGLHLDRSTPEGIERFFRDAREMIMIRHQCVGLHPEAHIQRPGKDSLGRGRPGAAQLALDTGCPVAPIALLGTESIFDNFGRGFILKRRAVTFRVGKALVFPREKALYDAADPETRKELVEGVTTHIMNAIAALTGQRYPFGERALGRLDDLLSGRAHAPGDGDGKGRSRRRRVKREGI